MANAANVKRFEGFEDFVIVDNIAQLYPYTHEEVMLLQLDFVLNLLYLQKQQREFADDYEEAHKRLNPPAK